MVKGMSITMNQNLVYTSSTVEKHVYLFGRQEKHTANVNVNFTDLFEE